MAWDRPILTDSGGFQVVSLGDLRIVDEDGVTFRTHLDGSTHRFTPEHAIAVQEALGSDIAVAFDQPVAAVVAARGRRRRDGADASLGGALAGGAHAAGPGAVRHHPGRPGAGSAGRVDRGSSRRCRSTGSASAGWPATRRPAQRDATLDVAVPLLADDPRPRYLMGLGSPVDLLDAVDRGVDLFDSVLPARVARNGPLWVPGGRLNLRNARFLDDPAPGPGGLSVPALPALLAGLSGPPVPGRRAARVPARDLSQPDLHPRLHGQDPGCDRGPEPSRFDAGACGLRAGRIERRVQARVESA